MTTERSRSPVEQWAADLAAWQLPQNLLDAAPESPYGWPAQMFRRWNRTSEAAADATPTRDIIRRHLGTDGLLVDIGAGTGRASLALARAGHPVVAVERDAGMADALRQEAAGLPIEVIEAAWPAAAKRISPAQVAVCSHVVYDVADIGPFVAAAADAADTVVMELTARHPWSDLAPLYRALHDLDRPDGPSVELLMAVVQEVVGRTPDVERWDRPAGMYFASWAEILAFYGKRLLIGEERHPELAALLEPSVRWVDGRAFVGGPRRLATVWWSST